jgi:putative ABC transport system substrate-binding protein
MRRREFITALGGAAAFASVDARAQQPMPVVAFIRSDVLPASSPLVAAFRGGLKETGFVEGQNVAIEFRSADNQRDRLQSMIAEMVNLPAAVIVANSFVANMAKAATTKVPIVFTLVSDPVGSGLVTSINRPGGNVTGVGFFSASLGAKRLELLYQTVPKATAIGLVVNPENPDLAADRSSVETAARTMGVQLIVREVKSQDNIERAFTEFSANGAGALLVGGGPFMFSNRELIVGLAERHRLPASYPLREYAKAGGLMSYGNSITDSIRQAGVYAGRILKGENPGDIPVLQSSKFEFVVNLKTAKALGVDVPLALQVGADEVIE